MSSDEVYVAMLRAVNVGGRSVAMKELRGIFEALPARDVSTYVQSGNVVFRADRGDPATVAGAAERLIAAHLGLRVAVIVRTADELARVIGDNPYFRTGADETRLHGTLLATLPEAARVAALAAAAPDSGHDEFQIVGRTVYVHAPDGYGRTKLNNAFFERKLGVVATTRNWRSLTTLSTMARTLRSSV
ncbi:MAG TPA: DUF1697 domain-containing protein [Acidimicrobiales bacterium]|jgi:uncharacterized protein (DUF1697 family)|nr:DUF1697 domain-containing protein [Acidimicrobiales bacterium]